nr:hypothetical protein [Escherichia coli]
MEYHWYHDQVAVHGPGDDDRNQAIGIRNLLA